MMQKESSDRVRERCKPHQFPNGAPKFVNPAGFISEVEQKLFRFFAARDLHFLSGQTQPVTGGFL